MNTTPYTNAREAGRTNPGKIEMLTHEDPRHPNYRDPHGTTRPNRALRRANGQRGPAYGIHDNPHIVDGKMARGLMPSDRLPSRKERRAGR